MNRRSCICGNTKNPTWDLCSECNEIYGNRSEWPEWLSFLVSDNNRIIYDNRKWNAFVFGYFEQEGVKPNRSKNKPIRIGGDNVLVGLCSLPYAPYQDEDDNKRYRKANGINESKASK